MTFWRVFGTDELAQQLEQGLLGAVAERVAAAFGQSFVEAINRFIEFMSSEDNG